MPDTRQRIVTATNELFRRQGYNGTSLKEVTAAAEAPTGSLYHFFPRGKAQLAEAVIDESGAVYQELFEVIADAASGPAEAIRAFFDGAADVLVESDFIDVCPIGGLAREVASVSEPLRLATARVFTGWIEAVTARLTSAGLPSADAADVATTVVAVLEGGFVLARSRRDAELLRGIGRQMEDLVATRISASAARPAPAAVSVRSRRP